MHLSFRIPKSRDFVFDYLTDMQKYVTVHPVISKMDDYGNGKYRVHETLKFLFIPLSFRYPATVESTAPDTVIMRATVMKLTKVEMIFILIADNDFTQVEEDIRFKSSLPLKARMQKIFRKQHTQLFKNIGVA